MPHTNHKKAKKHTKRAEVVGDDGWTRVTTTDQLQRTPRPLSAPATTDQSNFSESIEWYSDIKPSVPAPGTTFEQLVGQYKKFEGQWLESQAHAELEKRLKEIDKEMLMNVDKCFVFGTGSYCGHISGWIARFDVSMYQLAAFVSTLEIIEKITGCRPPAYAQEPVYNNLDVELLSSLQITTVTHPVGLESITSFSFVYLPYAELEVELSTLSANPAIVLVVGKLESYWRNAKGEACTDRLDVPVPDSSADEDSDLDPVFKPFHELTEDERRNLEDPGQYKDEIEKGLQICERFKQEKAFKSLPALTHNHAFTDMDSRVQDAHKAGNLDFDARVPIPISVFPSTYRSDATSVETTTTKVEGEVNLGAAASSRVGREDTRFSGKEEVDISVNQVPPRRDDKADFRVFEEKQTRVEGDKFYQQQYRQEYSRPEQTRVEITKSRTEGDRFYQQGPRETQIDITRTREDFRPSSAPAEIKDVHVDIHRERTHRYAPTEYKNVNLDVQVNQGPRFQNTDVVYDRPETRDQAFETQLDITERDYRRRVNTPTYDIEYERSRPLRETRVTVEREEVKTDKPIRNKLDMGYYDDQGNYHSFRRGVQRAVDHIVHPFSHHHDRVEVDETVRVKEETRESVRMVEPRHGGASANTVTIPCHFIRVGDLLILQGRPCQVIRISVSAQTGQYRYLGVDLFTKQLQEESSFVTNPEPSVVVQSMVGPVYKQYRILDLREDGMVVCMTETGDVKQGLPVVDQGNLYGKIDRAFADGRGSVRALVINDGGRELIVDYKVIHASRL